MQTLRERWRKWGYIISSKWDGECVNCSSRDAAASSGCGICTAYNAGQFVLLAGRDGGTRRGVV